MYQQQKRYNIAMNRFSDIKFGMGIVIKAEKDQRGSGGLKLQCIRNCHVFFVQFLPRLPQLLTCRDLFPSTVFDIPE